MTSETESLLYDCRAALLQRSDEQLAALLECWFEFMVGDESIEEVLDDLCLLLGYRVRSWGAKISYATYTAWWEVDGYLAPEGGVFVCAHAASLRQHLLSIPIEQFGLVMELAYQVRLVKAKLHGEPRLPTGHTLLRELATWLKDTISRPESPQQRAQPHPYWVTKTKGQRRMREQEIVAQARQRGYLVVSPGTTRWVKDTFRHNCKVDSRPYICVEAKGPQLAGVLADTRTLDRWSNWTLLSQIRDRLEALAEPYLARSNSCQHEASFHWVSLRMVVLDNVLAEDAQQVAQDLVALCSNVQDEARRQPSRGKKSLSMWPEPVWMKALERVRAQGQDCPPLPETVVLPNQWPSSLTNVQLSAFLAFLGLPARSRESKAALALRLLTRLETDQTARAQFFEVFARELAVPPWELETLLGCTPTERKRWTEEGKLPVLHYPGFGNQSSYPVFDRRVIMEVSGAELEAWRTEHRTRVQEHRRAGAQAAAATRRAKW